MITRWVLLIFGGLLLGGIVHLATVIILPRTATQDAFARLERMLNGKTAKGGPKKLAKGAKVTKEYLDTVARYDWFDIRLASEETAQQLEASKEALAKKRVDFDELLAVCAGWNVIAYENGFLNDPARFVQRIAAVRPFTPASPEAPPVRYPL